MRIAVLLVAACVAGAAQTLDGVVINSVTSAPVKKARITLRGSAEFSAISDGLGQFHLGPVAPGDYTALTVAQGFAVSLRRVRAANAARVTIALTPYGVISGKVRDEAGDPLSGVRVSALTRNYATASASVAESIWTATDDRGEFRLFDLPAGRYYIQLNPPATRAAYFYPGVLEFSQAAAVDVTPGSETAGIDFPVRPVASHHVRGRAVDAETGAPIHGVVTAEHCGAGLRLPFSTQVQKDGAFDILLPQGTYCLRIEAGSASRAYPVSVADRDLDGVVLASQPHLEIPCYLKVEGDEGGSPLSLRFGLESIDRAGSFAGILVKNAGAFSLRVVPDDYRLIVQGVPEDMYVKSIRVGEQDASDGIVHVIPGIGSLTVVLSAGTGDLQGVVQGAEFAGGQVVVAPVGALARRADLLQMVQIASDGSFAFDNVAPGEYRVFAWSHLEAGLATLPGFREALAAESVPLTMRPGGNETVSLKLASEAAIRAARKAVP